MPAPDPQRAAAALAYRSGDAAPRVVAKGRGLVADSIVEKARASGVYVHESRELLALLMQVDLDSHIPPQLYVAVAELLAWLYHLDAAGDGLPLLPAPDRHA
jgi:flagellar biosynthesis protein